MHYFAIVMYIGLTSVAFESQWDPRLDANDSKTRYKTEDKKWSELFFIG